MDWNLSNYKFLCLRFVVPRGSIKSRTMHSTHFLLQSNHHTQKCLFLLFIWRSKDRTNFHPFPQPFSRDTNPTPFRITNPTHKYWICFWYFHLPVPAIFRHACYAAAGNGGGVSGYLGGGCWGSSSGVGARVQRGDFTTTFGGLLFEKPVYCVHLI